MQNPEAQPNQDQQPNTFLNRLPSKEITKVVSIMLPSTIFVLNIQITIFNS